MWEIKERSCGDSRPRLSSSSPQSMWSEQSSPTNCVTTYLPPGKPWTWAGVAAARTHNHVAPGVHARGLCSPYKTTRLYDLFIVNAPLPLQPDVVPLSAQVPLIVLLLTVPCNVSKLVVLPVD